jgi:hypothetical protein
MRLAFASQHQSCISSCAGGSSAVESNCSFNPLALINESSYRVFYRT